MLITLVLPAPEGPNRAVAPPAAVEGGIQGKFTERFLDIDNEHRSGPVQAAVARRANHSDATSAASEMTTATTTSESAALSPPGTCVSV